MKKEPKDKEEDTKPKVSLFGDRSGDKDDIDNSKFLVEFVKTLLLVVIFGMGAFMLIRILYSPEKYGLPQFLDYLFYPFQYSNLYIVYGLSKLFGLEVTIETTDFIVDYPALGIGGRFGIASACTAVCEMGLIFAVIMAFRGPKWKKRLMWGGIFAGIIYVENIIRLMMNYPLYLYLGRDGWLTYHNFWMEWGQLIVVLALLLIYVQIIAKKDIMSIYSGKKEDENSEDEPEDPQTKEDSKVNKKYDESEIHHSSDLQNRRANLDDLQHEVLNETGKSKTSPLTEMSKTSQLRKRSKKPKEKRKKYNGVKKDGQD